ncbi:MAG: ATP-binding protein [Rhodothermales bacterium]
MMRSNLLLACLLAVAHTACLAQDTLSRSNISNWQPTWRFAGGDDSTWSDPAFDDNGWEMRDASLFNPGIVDSTGWKGIGWFRARFAVDSSLADLPIAYWISVGGAAEVYLDGKLIDHLGHPGPRLETEQAVRYSTVHPKNGLLPALSSGAHVLAFRVSNIFLSKEGETEFGFRISFGEVDDMAARLTHVARVYTAKTYSLTGIAAVIALIYLLLFAFQTKQIKNLLFGLLSGLAAIAIFADLQGRLVTDADSYVIWRRYMEIAGAAGWVVGVRLVGLSFFKETWKLFNVLLAIAALVVLYVFFDPIGGFWSLIVLGVLATLELGRRIGLAVFLSRPAAWVVALGLVLLILGGVHDFLVHRSWIDPVFGVNDLFHFGLVGFLTLMALFLGTEFARANRSLELRVIQVHQEAGKALQEEKVNQGLRIERIQAEFDKRRKDFELQKSREVDAIRKSLTVNEENLKALKNRLITTEAKAALGHLATGIAQDVNGLLNGIDNLTALSQDVLAELQQSVEKEGGGDKSTDLMRQLRKNIERVREQSILAGGIVDDILEHASGTKQEAQSVEVNQLIERYLNLALHSSRGDYPDLNLVVERVLDERVGSVIIPPVSLGRAMMGVFRNAIEAVSDHAKESGEDFQPTITVSTQRLEHAVLIRVRDNGPGVQQDLRDRIFEPFFSTSSDKSGLGLSIANGIIVDELKGTFGLEHFKEQGAGFYITIPFEKSDSEDAEEATSE